MGGIPVWGFHHPMECQIALYEALLAAGAACGIRDVGARAYEALRIEAGVPRLGLDYWCDNGLSVAGGDGAGRDNGDGRRLVRLTIEPGPRPVDPWGDEPVIVGGRDVGTITSGAFGYRDGKSVAIALVDRGVARPGTAVEVEILGDRYAARVSTVSGVP
jgi:dimethylglycine dehydrogenase